MINAKWKRPVWVWQDGSVGKGTCCQTWPPELRCLEPTRKEKGTLYRLPSDFHICAVPSTHPHIYTLKNCEHTHTHKLWTQTHTGTHKITMNIDIYRHRKPTHTHTYTQELWTQTHTGTHMVTVNKDAHTHTHTHSVCGVFFANIDRQGLGSRKLVI